MRAVWKVALWALVISLVVAGATLFLLVRFVLPTTRQSEPPPRYTVGEWDGYVAVFEGEQTYPKQVFDSFVEALPPEQRDRVRQGIPAEDDTALSLLLEDLTS